jgi:hypothetical protein
MKSCLPLTARQDLRPCMGLDSTTTLVAMRTGEHPGAGIDLFWIPLGAGGNGFVRLNGLIYEAAQAISERRPRRDLYHTALQVRVPEGRFTVENAWPSPNSDTASRGVVAEGPVFSRWMARVRPFRYEVRRWRDGVIADIDAAVASPQVVSNDPDAASRLLDLVSEVPRLVWGRDELATGDMWNSNSVIAWLLAESGLPMDGIEPPPGGRAPGWQAGIRVSMNHPAHAPTRELGTIR